MAFKGPPSIYVPTCLPTASPKQIDILQTDNEIGSDRKMSKQRDKYHLQKQKKRLKNRVKMTAQTWLKRDRKWRISLSAEWSLSTPEDPGSNLAINIYLLLIVEKTIRKSGRQWSI